MIAKQAVAAAAWLEATDIRTNPVRQTGNERPPQKRNAEGVLLGTRGVIPRSPRLAKPRF